jgi:hypothetical protein
MFGWLKNNCSLGKKVYDLKFVHWVIRFMILKMVKIIKKSPGKVYDLKNCSILKLFIE